jgi:tetratricopeptide (TPR) repeat protein
MNSGQQAYLNLINQLLNCPSGDEAEVLKTHPELLDDGLVATMLEVIDHLREKGELNSANWLQNFLGLLIGPSLTQIALKQEADGFYNYGYQHYLICDFPNAIENCEVALTIYHKIEDREGEAGSLNILGSAYDSLGQFQKSIDCYQQSLDINQEIGDRKGEADSLCGFGNAYYSLGQYHKAIKFHKMKFIKRVRAGLIVMRRRKW